MLKGSPATDEPALTDPTPALEAPESASPRRALYRRWRAQRFEEVVGQDPIVSTLRRAVATDRIVHAYLFVGPRGTGKTSTARILAKAINCTNRADDGEPCDTCPACVSIRDGRALDVIEIDAASHGLVDDARDLVMRALTAPADLRRRVYIIDEVHMLSPHAFNALLKLIEEPPDHVVFILATTDTHRVPPTIISRTQRYDFRRLPTDVIAGKLTRITTAEGVTADPAALELIARLADGGMRDAESLLDQVMAYAGDQVAEASVREAVGLADEEAIGALLDALLAGDGSGAPCTGSPTCPIRAATWARWPSSSRPRPVAGCWPRPATRPWPGSWPPSCAPPPRPARWVPAKGEPGFTSSCSPSRVPAPSDAPSAVAPAVDATPASAVAAPPVVLPAPRAADDASRAASIPGGTRHLIAGPQPNRLPPRSP